MRRRERSHQHCPGAFVRRSFVDATLHQQIYRNRAEADSGAELPAGRLDDRGDGTEHAAFTVWNRDLRVQERYARRKYTARVPAL